MASRNRQWSITSRIFVTQLVAVVLLSGLLTLLLWLDSRASADEDAARLSLAVTTTLAHDPFVIEAVQGEDPTASLQPYAVEVMDSAGVDFVTIMDTTERATRTATPTRSAKPSSGTSTPRCRARRSRRRSPARSGRPFAPWFRSSTTARLSRSCRPA